MQCTQRKTAMTRLLRPFAAVALTAGALLLVPAAEAQMNPPQARPQAQPPQTQSPQTPSPSASISDEKLNAAAAAIGQVATIQESYESKIAAAPPSDNQRLAEERYDALEKAVTDQGLSVDEYNSIIRTAQNDPTVREKLTQRIPTSGH
jgi:predicted ATPase with chaperone activity